MICSQWKKSTNFATHLAVSMLVLVSVACGSGTDDAPDIKTPALDINKPIDEIVSEITIDAKLRHWNDKEILVDYELRNDSDIELVVFDDSFSLQIERLADGAVRLFQGKQDTGDAQFESEPTILRLDYSSNSDRSIDQNLVSFEFCIGFGSLDELLPTRRDDGLYSYNQDLELQRFTCTDLHKPDVTNSGDRSALDEEHWERTLNVVLGAINDAAVVIALRPMKNLAVPQNDTEGRVELANFTLEDGNVGERARVSCLDGGHYDLTTTSAAFGDEFLSADNCVTGAIRIDGQAVRSTRAGDNVGDKHTLSLSDYHYDDGNLDLHFSTGTHKVDNGHPFTNTHMSGMNYRVTTAQNAYAMNNVEWSNQDIWGTAYDRSLTASFSIAAAATLDTAVTVSTPESLHGGLIGGQRRGSLGQLVLESEHGDSLTLDVDGGQQDTAMLTFDRAGVITTEFMAWDELFKHR